MSLRLGRAEHLALGDVQPGRALLLRSGQRPFLRLRGVRLGSGGPAIGLLCFLFPELLPESALEEEDARAVDVCVGLEESFDLRSDLLAVFFAELLAVPVDHLLLQISLLVLVQKALFSSVNLHAGRGLSSRITSPLKT